MLYFICIKSEIHFSDPIKFFVEFINFNCVRIITCHIKEFMGMVLTARIPFINMIKNISSKSISSITKETLFKFNSLQPNFTLPDNWFINTKINLIIDNFKSCLLLINILIYLSFTCTRWVN